jgi:hypothetical protein
MGLLPVENNSSLCRDSESGAIVNVSDSEYESYIRRKNAKLKEVDEIENLKKDVGELKDMMKFIISKLDSNS